MRRQRNYVTLYLFIFSVFRVLVVILTFLGASPVEVPFIIFSQLLTGGYFVALLSLSMVVVFSF